MISLSINRLFYSGAASVRDTVSCLMSLIFLFFSTGSALLFSCINEAFYRGSKHDLEEGTAGKGSMLPEVTRKFSEAFQFGIPNGVAEFLGPLGWDASADRAVKDVKDTYEVSSDVNTVSVETLATYTSLVSIAMLSWL